MKPEGAVASILLARTKKTRRVSPRPRTSTRSKKKRRPPPSKTTKPQRRPHVALIGNPHILIPLRAELDDLGIGSLAQESPAMLIEEANESTKAVVIAPPVPDESVEEICATLSAQHPRLPIFTVVRSTLPWKSEKRLYESGSMAVFLWPKEKSSLVQTLIGLVYVPRRLADQRPKDAALGKSVRERLRVAAELRDCRLNSRVSRGVVVLTGKVRGLWQIEAAASIVRSIPGVQHVVTDPIRVESEGPSDRVIEKTVRRLIRSISELDLSTLAVKVSQGEVTLAGTVGSSLELERASALIRQLRGVKSLQTFVTVSPEARLRDRSLAKEIERALAIRYPKRRIGVSAFGGVVVLRGSVPLAETRENIGKLVALHTGVERVVNKLAVRRRMKGTKEP